MPEHFNNSHVSLREAWGDVIDPWAYLDDASFHLAPSLYLFGGKEDGAQRPILRAENDLAAIRNTGRLLADTSPAAIGVMKNLTNYVVGSGFCYKAAVREGIESNNQVEKLLSAAQRVLGEFLEENDWPGDLERELFLRSRRDGEYFLAMFNQPGGKT